MTDAPTCNLCSGKEFTTQFQFKDYDLIRCKSCGLGILNPMPETHSDEFYSEEYYHANKDFHHGDGATKKEGVGYNALDPEMMELMRKEMAGKIDWLLSKRQVSSFLDVGCGVGLLVEAAAQRGIPAMGADFSSFAIEYGTRELGIRGLKHGLLEDVLDDDARFDVVYLNHVIEHVCDPGEIIAECMAYLAPGGWLILETPDIDSTESVRTGKDWGYIAPDHLYYFSTTTLPALVEKQGLKVLYVEKIIGSPGLLNSTFGDEEKARAFHDRWLNNAFAQVMIRWVRKIYGHLGQKMEVDYSFMKVVAEKA